MRQSLVVALGWTMASAADAAMAGRQVYVAGIAQAIAAHSSTSDWFDWEQAGAGGYIFRFRYDIDGDGVEDLFAASSLESTRLLTTWRVYRTTLGSMTPVDGEIIGGLFHFYSDKGALPPVIFTLGEERGLMRETRFTLAGNRLSRQVRVISRQRLEKIGHAMVEGIRFATVKPRIEAVLLAELLTDPGVAWRAVDESQIDPYDDFPMVKGEESRRAKYADFTPRDANRIINGIRAIK